jgi:hypothetical protein
MTMGKDDVERSSDKDEDARRGAYSNADHVLGPYLGTYLIYFASIYPSPSPSLQASELFKPTLGQRQVPVPWIIILRSAAE